MASHNLNKSLKAEIYWNHKDQMKVKIMENVYYIKFDFEIIVKKGFISDGGSIPKLFWWILAPFEDYAKCCIIHDALCDLWHFQKKNSMSVKKIYLKLYPLEIIFHQIT